MKRLLFIPLIGIIAWVFFAHSSTKENPLVVRNTANTPTPSVDSFAIEREEVYQEEVTKAAAFLKEHSTYNQDIAILIDFRIPSQKYRLFLHDMKNDSILDQSLVSHGSGSDKGDSLYFSNVPNSYCSSIGKYRIGAKYTGNFGKSYKLHGLDSTNSKAYERYIVFHPYSMVPDEEQEYPIVLSLGCPMVSPAFMNKMYPILDGSKGSVLMVIYY